MDEMRRGTRGLEGASSNSVSSIHSLVHSSPLLPFSTPLPSPFPTLFFPSFPVFASPLSRYHSSSFTQLSHILPLLGGPFSVFAFPLVLSFSHFHPLLPILPPNTRECAHARGALGFAFFGIRTSASPERDPTGPLFKRDHSIPVSPSLRAFFNVL